MNSLARQLLATPDPELLAGLLLQQQIVAGDPAVAGHLARASTLVETARGQAIIEQGATGTDLYLILAGRASVLVNGREVAERGPGEHVGEMALIDPEAYRSATVLVTEDGVFARVTEPDFTPIATTYPELWRRLGRELVKRAKLRYALVPARNTVPKLLIVASDAARALAVLLKECLADGGASIGIWTSDIDDSALIMLDSLDSVLADSDFALLLIAPDEPLTPLTPQGHTVKEKLAFELGYLLGLLGRERVALAAGEAVARSISTGLLATPPLILPATADRTMFAPVAATLGRLVTTAGPR